MKHFFAPFFSVLLVLLTLPGMGQGKKPFEGTIMFVATGKGAYAEQLKDRMPTQITYRIKGQRSHYISSGGAMNQDILNLGDKAFALSKKRKTAFRMSLDDMETADPGKVTPTDSVKTILGYRCRKYIQENEPPGLGMKVISHVWATEDLNIQKPEFKNNGMFNEHIPGFPLLMQTFMGPVEIEFRAKSVKPGPVADIELAIPAGYQHQDLPAGLFMEMQNEKAE